MKKYVLTCALLAAAVAVEARAARPSRARLQEQAVEAMAEADSLRRLSGLQGAAIDSLQNLLDRMEARLENRARTARESSDKPADPNRPLQTPSPTCSSACSANRSNRRSIPTD